jgi:hypothetical protein
MAYKSQVTQKWIGSTNKGAVQHIDARKTEMGQIVTALKNDLTPALNNYSDKYIERKQDTAKAKMLELNASGMSVKAIHKGIMNGDYEELSNQYVKKVVDSHSGRFEAVETIRKIEEAGDDYNYKDTEGTIEDFWKKHLPNLNESSADFRIGFAAAFNEWSADEKVNDAKLRAQWAHDKKIMNGVKYLDRFAVHDMSKYWDSVKTLNTEMPKINGEKAHFFDNDEMNEVAMSHVEWILANATDSDELDVAIQILTSDRGKGKGGNNLGSLISTRDPAVADLLDKINVRQANLVQKERRDEVYNNNKKVEEVYADAMKGKVVGVDDKDGTEIIRPYNIDELNEIVAKELSPLGDLNVVENFRTFFSESRKIDNTPSVTNAFMMEIAEGGFGTYSEMVAEMNKRGIPQAKLGTANARWTTYMSNKDKGIAPVYIDKVVYSANMTQISKDIVTSFTDKTTGITQNGAQAAVFNAENYMKDEILTYEAKFEKENGRAPDHEERRKYIEDLGKHVMEVYKNAQVPEPEGLISMEDKEAIDTKTTALQETKQMDEKADQIVTNIKALVESGIELPKGDFTWWGDDTTWRFDSTDKKNFYNNDILPKVEEYVKQILDGVGLDASYFGELDLDKSLGVFPIEMQDELVALVAENIFGKNWNQKHVKDIKDIIGKIVGVDPDKIGSNNEEKDWL